MRLTMKKTALRVAAAAVVIILISVFASCSRKQQQFNESFGLCSAYEGKVKSVEIEEKHHRIKTDFYSSPGRSIHLSRNYNEEGLLLSDEQDLGSGFRAREMEYDGVKLSRIKFLDNDLKPFRELEFSFSGGEVDIAELQGGEQSGSQHLILDGEGRVVNRKVYDAAGGLSYELDFGYAGSQPLYLIARDAGGSENGFRGSTASPGYIEFSNIQNGVETPTHKLTYDPESDDSRVLKYEFLRGGNAAEVEAYDEYYYNEEGDLSSIVNYNMPFGDNAEPQLVSSTVYDYDYDENGNWVEMRETYSTHIGEPSESVLVKTVTRNFEYYGG